MINFVLKYTGTYGLLAILALAIVTPSYFFFSNQQDKLSEASPKKQSINSEEKILDKGASEEKTKENVQKRENDEAGKQENKINLEEIESLSVDVFRVDELGNIISAGKVSKKARIEILADNKKIIGADETAEDGSFVVFGKVQSTGLVQSVKIRGLIEDEGQKKIVNSADLFFVLPQVERDNEKEVNKIEKTPLIVQDDGNDLKVLLPIQVSSVDSITLDTISYTENSSTELAGRARLAYSVRIYLNNKLESEAKVSESGAWKAALSNVQAGVYTLRLDEVSENGKVEGRLELPFKREEEALIQAMGEGSITVQPGNSLWRIARKYYGKGIQYVEIFERNSHLIRDPDLIYPGQIFSLPN
ncbi:LysM peptidoglycan-binding domain-containing protein [Paracoccaceae bacterium]|nr:LysM peptidoglycan-binding domain-containing protein [Paracoccaceae bacterium]